MGVCAPCAVGAFCFWHEQDPPPIVRPDRTWIAEWNALVDALEQADADG